VFNGEVTPRALHAPARLAGLGLLRTQSDERLVDLVRSGNDGAFEAIVARYRQPLLRYCSGLLPGGRAEDAVQQTFLRAYDALRASDSEMALRPWLYRIAHNSALNALRDRSLRYEELSEGIDGVERPDQALEKSERLRDTVAAVRALPERQRDAVVLRELEGRSYDQIAAELGVTGGAVRQLLNRARGTLRQGMTALVPFGFLARIPPEAGSELTAARLAELCGMGAGAAVGTKAAATALVTGAVVAGVATVPSGGPGDGRASAGTEDAQSTDRAPGPVRGRTGLLGGRGGDPRGGDGDRSGRRAGDGDRSGPSRGDDDGDDRSRSGSSGSGSDSSGSGSSGSGSSGSGSGGSGSGSSGSGSSGSGSGGSGSSGSGSSASGSGSSGSGSSGSGFGSSSSGSSGSGSGSDGSGSSSYSGSSGSGSEPSDS
jgi:RNA polymerase sigma factor (sigma-70 family)